MNYEEKFISIWNSIGNLEIPEPPDDTICKYALKFQIWVDRLLKVLENPDIVRLNQAKILLIDHFFVMLHYVPQAHRTRLGIHGHRCIFQVFEDAYEKIRFVELDLTPPTIFLQNEPPPVPPLMRPPNIAGIFLGEDLDKDDE